MYKQSPKSPLMKALIGKQKNLPEALKAKIMGAPESPAKAMQGPGIPEEAGKTGTAGANSAQGKNAPKDVYEGRVPRTEAQTPMGPPKPGPKAPQTRGMGPRPDGKAPLPGTKKKSTTTSKPKWDKELNSLVSQRKGLKKGTAEYNKVQNRINEKLGSGVRRSTEEAVKLKPKSAISTKVPKPDIVRSSTNTKPAAKKPTVKKQSAADKQAASFEADLAKQNAKAPMGSERGSKAPAAKPSAKKPVAAKKPAAKKTAGQKLKGTVRKARLAQLDRKANRQEARNTRKTARKTARADKLREKADKLSSPAKQVNTKKLKKAGKALVKAAIGPGGVAAVRAAKKYQRNKNLKEAAGYAKKAQAQPTGGKKLSKAAKEAFESGKMDKYGKPTIKKTASEAFKSGKMDKYAKSPAKKYKK